METHDTDGNGNTHDRAESERGRRGRRSERTRRRARDGGRRRERKERVLHTRISDQLAEDIRTLADDLRVPASNLVRNVLEEVFTMVDSVSDDVGDLMDELIDEAEDVRDRVRGQRFRRADRSGRSRRRRPASRAADVEEELRTDEADEARERARSRRGSDADRAGAADASTAAERPAAAELFPEVLGWQPLVLNRDGACGRCERALRAGESAFLGMAAGGLTETALCGRCASSGAGSR